MPLTDRQLHIARYVLRGKTNEEIADQLQSRYPGLTARTVREECNAMRSCWPGSKLPARQRIILHFRSTTE